MGAIGAAKTAGVDNVKTIFFQNHGENIQELFVHQSDTSFLAAQRQ